MKWSWRCLLVASLILLVAFLYCVAGVLQAAWLSATPGYPIDRARINSLLWGIGSVVTFGLLTFVIVRLTRLKRRED
jgi:hypothetical protein